MLKSISLRSSSQEYGEASVDSIDGLSPAISIDQKTTSKNHVRLSVLSRRNQRYLRLLYALCGNALLYQWTWIKASSVERRL